MILLQNDVLTVHGYEVGMLNANCYVLVDVVSGNAVVIDPGGEDEEMMRDISGLKVKILAVLNTHGHSDHIAANAVFGMPVMIHGEDEKCLFDPGLNLSAFSGCRVSPVEDSAPLDDGDIIPVGQLSVEVIHTPGHTPGGVCFKCGNVLFTGDTLFREGIGRSDLPGGDHNTLIRSIKERLLVLPEDTVVFPGHGPSTMIGHEARNNPFL